MNWKTIIIVPLSVTLGVVAAQSYFQGFDPVTALIVGIISFVAAMSLGYITTLGKRQ